MILQVNPQILDPSWSILDSGTKNWKKNTHFRLCRTWCLGKTCIFWHVEMVPFCWILHFWNGVTPNLLVWKLPNLCGNFHGFHPLWETPKVAYLRQKLQVWRAQGVFRKEHVSFNVASLLPKKKRGRGECLLKIVWKRDAYDYHNTQIKCPWQVPFLRKLLITKTREKKKVLFFLFIWGGRKPSTNLLGVQFEYTTSSWRFPRGKGLQVGRRPNLRGLCPTHVSENFRWKGGGFFDG